MEVQGNNGGSFIAITREDKEKIHLRVGWECAIQFDGVMKVDDLAKFLSKYAEEIDELCEEV